MELLSILPKKTQRLYAIMSYLYFQGPTVDEQKMAQNIGTTLGQLTLDLQELTLLFPEIKFSADKAKNQQKITSPLGFDSISSRLIADTLEVRLLPLLLFEKHDTQTQLADALYISTSSCNRLIFKLETFFRVQNIKIKTRPMRLEGDELAIRNFYCHFLREIRPSQESSFLSTEQEVAMERFLYDYFRHNQAEESYGLRNKLFRSLFVAYIRQKNQHFLKQEHWQHPYLKDPQVTHPYQVAHLTSQLKLNDPQGMRLPDLMWLTYGNFQLVNQGHLASVLAKDCDLTNLSCFIENYLQDAATEFALQLPNSKKVAVYYRFLQDNLELRPQITPVVLAHRPIDSFLDKAQNYYPDSTKKITEFITAYCQNSERLTSITFEKRLLYLTLNELPETVFGPEELNILLMSNLDPSHTQKMKETLQTHFGRKAHFSTIPNLFSEEEMMFDYFSKYDLIISTFTVAQHFDHYPLFLMEPFVTFPDLERLHRKIQELIHQKRGTYPS